MGHAEKNPNKLCLIKYGTKATYQSLKWKIILYAHFEFDEIIIF